MTLKVRLQDDCAAVVCAHCGAEHLFAEQVKFAGQSATVVHAVLHPGVTFPTLACWRVSCDLGSSTIAMTPAIAKKAKSTAKITNLFLFFFFGSTFCGGGVAAFGVPEFAVPAAV